jgi:hypothetical protein
MAELIGQGGTITLDGIYEDGTRAAVDPTDPRVSIIDPTGGTFVDLAVPTHVGLGHFAYDFVVPADAELGAWEARWYGLINSVQVGPVDDGFTVVAAGSIVPGSASDGATCRPWATHEDIVTGPCSDYSTDPDELDAALQVASDVLWNFTGRRYPGICTDKVRPQAQWKSYDGPPRWWPSTLFAGAQSPWGFCSCHRGRETGCSRLPEIKLPGHPVNPESVVIILDGVPFTEFRLDDHRYLIRVDGDGWPCCQNLRLEDDQPNTWSISYDYGLNPPLGGKRAAMMLGCQLLLAFDPATSGKCELPARVKTLTRAGTTISLLDPLDLFDKGRTGLPTVDLWVSSDNLGRARRRSTLMIPGRNRAVRRAGR